MIKRILITIFSAPAAIGIIDKLSSNLSPLLERLVLNFDLVSDYIWSQLSLFLNANFTPFGDLLTFILLLLIPVCINSIVSLFRSNDQTKKNKNIRTFNFFISCAFIAVILFSLELEKLWIPLILPSMVLVYFREYFLKYIYEPKKILKYTYFSIAILSLTLIIGVPIFLKIALVENNESAYSSVHWSVFMFVGLILSWIFFRATDFCSESITNTALWVSGILILNWVTEIVIPYFRTLLDNAGA